MRSDFDHTHCEPGEALQSLNAAFREPDNYFNISAVVQTQIR